jgi:hypothetical protein
MGTLKSIWSAYRITWLLYLGILLIPVMIFLIYSQMAQLSNGAATVRKVSESGGSMLVMALTDDPSLRQKARQLIEADLKDVGPWYSDRDHERFYVGPTTPREDFRSLQACWERLSAHPDRPLALKCWSTAKSLAFATERMNMLALDHIRNYFFFSIALSVILLLLMVYVIRHYIYHQVCQKIAHGPSEGLHDRELCRMNLTMLCALSERSGQAFSALKIHIAAKGGRQAHLKDLAEALLKIESHLEEHTRKSDAACRIGERDFVLLLPNTDGEGARHAQDRLKRLLDQHLGKLTDSIEITFTVVTKEGEEKCTSFWKRISKKGR